MERVFLQPVSWQTKIPMRLMGENGKFYKLDSEEAHIHLGLIMSTCLV